MRFTVLTIFPQMFEPVFEYGVVRRAIERKLIALSLVDLRDYTDDAHRSVDDRPYGGGPGMVMKVEPVVRACREVVSRGTGQLKIILTSPQGRTFNQATAEELARHDWLLFIAGRYEGYDERIREILQPEEISIGDYVLTGGELPVMVMIDAIARLVPGVLGCGESLDEESFSPVPGGGSRLLEYPQYTRPAEFEGRKVPEVLLSGDHERVREWRREQAEKRTNERRPDLLKGQ